MKAKRILLSIVAVCLLGIAAYRLAQLRRYDPSRLDTGKNASDNAAAIYAQSRAALPTPVSSGTMLDLSKDSEFMLSKISPDGSKTATLIRSPLNGDPRKLTTSIRFDFWNDKKHSVVSEAQKPELRWCYSLEWISNEDVVFSSRITDIPRGSFDLSNVKSSLFRMSALDFGIGKISEDLAHLPVIIGHGKSELYLVDNVDGGVWKFEAVSLTSGATLRNFAWAPFNASNNNAPVLGAKMALRPDDIIQRSGTSEISIFANSVTSGAMSELYMFDMASMKFIETPPNIKSFFQKHIVDSVAWSTDGRTFSCSVTGQGIYLLTGDRVELAVKEPARIHLESLSSSFVVYSGLRNTGEITQAQLLDIVSTIKRPFYFSL